MYEAIEQYTLQPGAARELVATIQNVGTLRRRPPEVVVGEIALRHAVAALRAT